MNGWVGAVANDIPLLSFAFDSSALMGALTGAGAGAGAGLPSKKTEPPAEAGDCFLSAPNPKKLAARSNKLGTEHHTPHHSAEHSSAQLYTTAESERVFQNKGLTFEASRRDLQVVEPFGLCQHFIL